MSQFHFKAIGTTWVIDIYDKLSVEDEKKILTKIEKRIEEFDQAYSRFRKDSIVTKISKEAGSYIFPKDSKLLFSTYYDLYKINDGYFTPLIGQMLVDAGYDAEYSLKQKKKLITPPRWEDVMEFDEIGSILKVKKPIQLDFGAAGKGYIIDLIGDLLKENGYDNFCIDAGGDILRNVKDSSNIRVGLEDPTNPEQVVGVYELSKGSICGSALNRRVWGDFSHVINTKTLVSPKEISAVWVTAGKTLIADAMTTCLFFVMPEILQNKYDFEYLIVKKDRSFEKSNGFVGEIFIK